MEVFAGEFASRLVAFLLRPMGLITVAVIPLAVLSGLAARVALLVENLHSSPAVSLPAEIDG